MAVAKVSYSVVDASFLKLLVQENFPIGEVSECDFYYRGVNDTYLIANAEGERFVLRVYRKDWRNFSQIGYEVEVLVKLEQLGASVAKLIKKSDGAYIGTLQAPEGKRYYIMMECIGEIGSEYHAIRANESEEYGRAVFELHSKMIKLDIPSHRFSINLDYLLFNPLRALSSYLKGNLSEFAYFEKLALMLSKKLEYIGVDNLTKSIIHGDLTGGNVGVDDKGNMAFFDFDCCGYGYLAYDLAVFRWSARNFGDEMSHWAYFAKGYDFNPLLNDYDNASLPIYVAARELWNIGYDISQTISGSRIKCSNRQLKFSADFLQKWEADWCQILDIV